MNILIDILPTEVKIDNKKYKINSDFRTSILFELMIQDDSIAEKDIPFLAMDLYYPVRPENHKEAIEKILWFYKCGVDEEISSKKSESSNSKDTKKNNIYSFEYDANYIYAAFLNQYGIDLQDIENLHWWKFRAMFKALNEDNLFVKIMGYRDIDLSKIEDKDEKERYKKLKELYKLPSKVDKEEKAKINEIESILASNGVLNG